MMWTSDEIVASTGGRLVGAPFSVNAVAIDSRKLLPGALFVALKGERFDGHAYVDAAFTAGAVAALVEQVPAEATGGTYVVVRDVYEALLAMAQAARSRVKGKVIAVTGSVGKTGTKEAIRTAASAMGGEVYATKGNLNNHIGLPLSLCNLPRDAAYGIFELGMNHAGEIAFLTRIARPDVAVITNVEAVHLEFFSGVEAIARAKAEIMEGMAAGATLVLNRDNASYEQLHVEAAAHGIEHVLTFGEETTSDFRLVRYKVEATGEQIEAHVQGVPLSYHLGATGKHWALASLAALAAVTAAGGNLETAAAALSHFHEPDGRGRPQILELPQGKVMVIDDCYNASPVSVVAALAKLAELQQTWEQGGRKVAILGDMLELGESSPQLHQSLAGALEKHGVDKLLAAGPLMQHLFDAVPVSLRGIHASDAQQLALLAPQALQGGDVILIKGSRGSRMDIVRDALQNSALHLTTKEAVNAL